MLSLIDNNPDLFNFTFQEVLSSGSIPDSYRGILESHFTRRGLGDPRSNANGYAKALGLLLEYLEGEDTQPIINGNVGDSNKIKTEFAYNISWQVYDGTIGRTEGKEEIARITGINPNSAADFIFSLVLFA